MAKYADHLPLYRQERIFGRARFDILRYALAQWVGVCGVRLQPLADALREALLGQAVLHADETPIKMLAPGRSGEHARNFLGDWSGKLGCCVTIMAATRQASHGA